MPWRTARIDQKLTLDKAIPFLSVFASSSRSLLSWSPSVKPPRNDTTSSPHVLTGSQLLSLASPSSLPGTQAPASSSSTRTSACLDRAPPPAPRATARSMARSTKIQIGNKSLNGEREGFCVMYYGGYAVSSFVSGAETLYISKSKNTSFNTSSDGSFARCSWLVHDNSILVRAINR